MPSSSTNLGNKSGGLVESFRNDQPRVTFLALIIAGLLLILVGGLAYQQVIREAAHSERGERQSRRVTITPGPRGEIYDRYGRVLVGNQHRLAVVLDLGKLQREVWEQKILIRKKYREYEDSNPADTLDLPSDAQLTEIARVNIAQKYLDQVNAVLHRKDQVKPADLRRHFSQELLLPFTLLDNLTEDQFARLYEQIPADSPIRLDKYAVREYPYGAAAAHILGEVRWESDIDADPLPGTKDVITFKSKGLVGRTGLEQKFESLLRGEAGSKVIRVNPGGREIGEPLEQRLPKPGQNLTTSLDIDLQTMGEKAYLDVTGGLAGAFVALEVNTGEVLAMASFPNYDLRETSPRMSVETRDKIEASGGWLNRATNGLYLPGSTFKLVMAIAGMKSGVLTPESRYVATGGILVGDRYFRDAAGEITGDMDFRLALEASVNSYFIRYGLPTGADAISAEANRLHFNEPTGLELGDSRDTYVGNDVWKRRENRGAWTQGDTANLSIGQGYISVTPLQMATFIAAFARGDTKTQPYLVHNPARPRQQSEPLGLTPGQYSAIVEGMEHVMTGGHGTARRMASYVPEYMTPGLIIAGKTGTAQKDTAKGRIELGWFVCFAPVDDPQIAIAVVVEGDTAGENLAGGRYAAPVAQGILKKWWDKQQRLNGGTVNGKK